MPSKRQGMAQATVPAPMMTAETRKMKREVWRISGMTWPERPSAW